MLRREAGNDNCLLAAARMVGIHDYHCHSWAVLKDYVDIAVENTELDNFDNFKLILEPLSPPVFITRNPGQIHVGLFLGFNENGKGYVFEKGNFGVNHPWQLVSLRDFYNDPMMPTKFFSLATLRSSQ